MIHGPDELPDELVPYRDALTATMWSALLLDSEWRVRWVSEELRSFVSDDPDADFGVGKHIAEAVVRSPWIEAVNPDSVGAFVEGLAPYAHAELRRRQVRLEDVLPADILPLFDAVEPVEPPASWSMTFSYLPPNAAPDEGYDVDIVFIRLFDGSRELGCVALFDIAVPPRLVALLARGDQDMYDRMARLVEPGHREAAIMFCDLAGSGTLSRKLPTAEYFSLVSQLWRGVDAAVSTHGGIIGKHAGDGATAFFLADDVGGRSAAARAAVLTARAIHEIGETVFRDVADEGCLMKVGLHWGPNLFMGQLVPGGRLDVTALGDEVNEASRIEQAATAHQTLASKQLLEGLSAVHAEELGINTSALHYELLVDLVPDSEKIVRDAGSIAVTVIETQR